MVATRYLAFGAALAAALLVVLAQPLTAPWWIYADADASYTASGIDLMAGEHSFYLDHPGMPLESLMAITVESRYVAHKLLHTNGGPRAYAGGRLLHLDDSRLYFRGYALIFYVLGALAAYVVLSRWLGGPLWGLAGTLLWLGAPGLQVMSIQFRPDGLLAGLVLLVGYLLVRATERRDAWLYTLAALLLGLAISVKLHAAGIFIAFAIALAWRPPPRSWFPGWRVDLKRWLRRYRVPLLGFAFIWTTFCVVLDRNRVPFSLTHEQKVTCGAIAVSYFAYIGLLGIVALPPLRRFARGPLRPVGGILVTGLLAGVVLPATVVINDLPEMLVKIVGAFTGGQVNQNVPLFTLQWSTFTHGPLLQALVVFAIGIAGAAVGVARRDLRPLIWSSAAFAVGLMAAARLGTAHYFAPAYVLSIPPALWLVQRLPRRLAAPAAAVLVVAVFGSVVRHLLADDHHATFVERQSVYTQSLVNQLVTAPGTVALTEDYVSATPDIRYLGLVQHFVAWSPPYPYRLLSDNEYGLQTAEARQLVPTYYIGLLPLNIGSRRVSVHLAFGSYEVKPLPQYTNRALEVGVMKLLRGPGVDRPLGRADAMYDPSTGFFKDAAGYWDISGNQVENPVRRRYLSARHLWVDAYGDLWNAAGEHVGNDPSLRTAK